jgi:dihydroflavonol-4-reductase
LACHTSYWAGRPVCVTGGTGFLGYHLVRLLSERGAVVRVLALPPKPDHPLRRHTDVSLIEGDIRDAACVRRAVAGCDIVFHAAGMVSVWGPALAAAAPVHIEGTQNVLAAAGRATRVVHTSSVMAVGATRDGAVLDEWSPYNLARLKLPYCQAKRAAEDLALAAARDVVVTNPGYLVGPHDHTPSVMGRFCLRFWGGRLPMAPPGGINLVDVRDAAEGHLLAAEHGRAGERYILGGENGTFAAFMAALAGAAGYAPRGLPRLPLWLLTTAAGLAEARAWFTGKEPYPALGHVRLNRYYWYYRSDKAAKELGFRSRPLAETLAEAYRWFRERTTLQPRGLNGWWLRPGRAA